MGNRLLYCVHAILLVPHSADGPSSEYASLNLEMIACAPILKVGTTGDSSAL